MSRGQISNSAYEFSTRSLIPLPNFRSRGRSIIWVDRAVTEVSAVGMINNDSSKRIMMMRKRRTTGRGNGKGKRM